MSLRPFLEQSAYTHMPIRPYAEQSAYTRMFIRPYAEQGAYNHMSIRPYAEQRSTVARYASKRDTLAKETYYPSTRDPSTPMIDAYAHTLNKGAQLRVTIPSVLYSSSGCTSSSMHKNCVCRSCRKVRIRSPSGRVYVWRILGCCRRCTP